MHFLILTLFLALFSNAVLSQETTIHETAQLPIFIEKQIGASTQAAALLIATAGESQRSNSVAQRNALITRVVEEFGAAEKSIMPAQLETPRYEQIFVAARARRYAFQTLRSWITAEGDDYTSDLLSARLSNEIAGLTMLLRSLQPPEDYLSNSRKHREEFFALAKKDANFQFLYTATNEKGLIEARHLAKALFLTSVVRVCQAEPTLCNRALPQ